MLNDITFLVPLLIALFIYIFLKKDKNIENIKKLRDYFNNKDIDNSKFKKIYSLIKQKYELTFLKYSKLKFEKVIKIKLLIFISVISLLFLIKATNIMYHTYEAFNKYEYTQDLFYKFQGNIDAEKALEEERYFLEKALEEIKENDFIKGSKEDIQYEIEVIINKANMQNELPFDSMANKIYYRMRNYYTQRQINIPLYVAASILTTFSIEIYFYIMNSFKGFKAKEELRILKRIMILYGSIKPTNFKEVLKNMIQRSYYNQNFLREIEKVNDETDSKIKSFYGNYISLEKDIDKKLFYEKLDEANNYDFDKAIINIKNEFALERRERQRKIKKREEFMHTIGLTGFMVIFTVTLLYLIIPWMQFYSIDNIM